MGTWLLVTFSNNGVGPALPRCDAKGGDFGGRVGGCIGGRGAEKDRAELGDDAADDGARVVTSL
jgi:hypothetical protein